MIRCFKWTKVNSWVNNTPSGKYVYHLLQVDHKQHSYKKHLSVRP